MTGKSTRPTVLCLTTLATSVASAPGLPAQVETEAPPVVAGARPVTLERIKIRGTALEGNLEGNAVDRDAIVFLPPSYATEKARRYPVVYALHGYSVGAEHWSREIRVPQTLEAAFAVGARERTDAAQLHDALDRYGIANDFEVYPGTHSSGMAVRFQNHVMKFFGESLCFGGGCR